MKNYDERIFNAVIAIVLNAKSSMNSVQLWGCSSYFDYYPIVESSLSEPENLRSYVIFDNGILNLIIGPFSLHKWLFYHLQ